MRLETQNARTLRLAHNTGSAVRFTPARGPQGLPGPGSAAWAADTAVTTGAVRQAPDGSWIKSTGNRTTRPTFDATEATFWEAVLASSGTVEATALTAAIARTALPGSAPADITTRNGGYDARLNLYNLKPAHLRRTRAALAAARLGVDDCRIAIIGDSTTYGANSYPGTGDYPTVLRKMLDGAGFPSKGEIVIGYNATITTGTTDPRLSMSGSWGALSGIFGYAAATASLLLTSTEAGTALRFITADATPLQVTIDGGSPQTLNPTGSGYFYTATVTGLADTTHSVLVEWVSGVLILHAIEVYSPAAGVRMLNAGTSGQASDWHANSGDTTWGTIPTLTGFAPHLVLINIGINDVTPPTGQTTPFAANVQKLITQLGDTADVVLIAHTNCDDRDYTAQRNALYDLADSNDLPLVDFGDALGTYDQMFAVGTMNSDPLHPTSLGYGAMARTLFNALAL